MGTVKRSMDGRPGPTAAPSGTAALEKGLDVLAAVTSTGEPLDFATLSEMTGLPRSTLHRILTLLVTRGLVMHDSAGHRFVPGLGLLEMARRSWESSDIRSAASGPLRHLAREVGEAVHLATLVDLEVVYLDKVESEHPVRLYSAIGKRGPVHCTAVGKAMAAFLPELARAGLLGQLSFEPFTENTILDATHMQRELEEVRRTGVAFDREEHQLGVHCVAAPAFDFRGHPVGAISITSPVFRVTRAQLEAFALRVVAAAATATATLGGRQPSGKS